jgi:hypothetical protein
MEYIILLSLIPRFPWRSGCFFAKLGSGANIMIKRLLLALAVSAIMFAATAPQFTPGVKTGNVECKELNEASGLAASRKNAGVLWSHNDSGDTGRVFAMDTTGKHLGVYNLNGVTAVDCEDIAIGPGPIAGRNYLYLGDIGDNIAQRSKIMVYRVAEPTVSTSQAPVTINLSDVETLWLQYEDGPRDAETLIIDPVNGDMYIVSKRDAQPRVYRAAASSLGNGKTTTLVYKTKLSLRMPTAGDISKDGSEIVIREYQAAYLWQRPAGGNLWEAFNDPPISIPIALEPQGEAIALTKTGYYTTSEGVNQPIYFFARKNK